jgi:Helix-turn-helix domain
MKRTDGFTLPATFVVTVSLAWAEIPPTAQVENDIMTVAEVADILRCKPSSVYNMTRKRGAARYAHPIPVIKLPCGLRFSKVSVLAWLKSQEKTGGV